MKYVLYTMIAAVIMFNTAFWSKVTADTYQLLEIKEELKVGLMVGHKNLYNSTIDYPKWILPTRIYGLYQRLRDEVGDTINDLETTREDPVEQCDNVKEVVKTENNKPKKEYKMIDPPRINF